MRTVRIIGWVAAAVVVAATPALAQKPPKIPPGQLKKLQPAPGGAGFIASADPALADGRVRSLGAWLDDARVLASGESWLGLSFTRWVMPIASGADTPAVDVTFGITRRVQASVSAPYSRATDSAGLQTRGMGDWYLGTKLQLRDPDAHRVGLALAPTLEVVSGAGDADLSTRRVNWLLPVHVEWHDEHVRVYGSTGYFSRGVLFASGAVERAVNDRMVVTGALSQAYSSDRNALSEQIGLRRSRLDLTGSLSYVMSPALAVFGSFGRTISGMDPDSTRLLASVGLSVNVAAPRTSKR
jgi:hypothetical protein